MRFVSLPAEIYGSVVGFTRTVDRIALRKTSKAIREATDLDVGFVVLSCTALCPNIVDLQRRDLVSVFVPSPKRILCLAVEESMVAMVVHRSRVVGLYDVVKGRHLDDLDHENVVRCAFSANGQRLATMSLSETKFWNIKKGTTTVAFSYSQSDADKEDGLWHVGGTFLGNRCLTISTTLTGETFADGQPFHCVRLRDAETGLDVMSFSHLITTPLTCIFCPRRDWVAIFLLGGFVVLSPIGDDGAELGRILVIGAKGNGTFSPDGSTLIMTADKDNTVYVANLRKLLMAIYLHLNNPDDDDYPHIDLTRNPPEVSQGIAIVPLRRNDDDDTITNCSFSPDARHILTAQGSRLHLYDATTNHPLTTINFNSESSYHFVMSPCKTIF